MSESKKTKATAPGLNSWLGFVVCLVIPVYLELMLHLFVYGSFTSRAVYPVLFGLVIGSAMFALCSVFPKRVNKVLFVVVSCILVLYFEIQFVYNAIFGEFMPVWQFSFGTTAITNFWRQMLYGIWHALVKVILLLLPAAAAFLLAVTDALKFDRLRWKLPVAALVLCVLLHLAALGVMQINADAAYSAYRLYTSADTSTEISVRNIGLMATTRIEIQNLAFPDEDDSISGLARTEKFELEDAEKYNVMELDFDKLASTTEDEAYLALDSYFAAQEPTEVNEYTGIFKDYNLVMFCAESYSPYFIDEELTPALYELTHNGFIFNNYYGSFGSNTTNGEYTMCMGLFPDLSRSKSTASFYISQQNYVPFCMGNVFYNSGAVAYAYHNYDGEYYARNYTHRNMGYNFKSATSGLDMEIMWPSSDLEMMQKSLPDYISENRFIAYYMTFSGHYQYNWENPMSAKNKAVVDSLPYSDAVKAYIACNLELEYALEELMDSLEEAGVADKTVIVLTNDHYPYGLNNVHYNELAGREIDESFEKFRNSFICYVPGMHVEVDTYCSTVDILPTLLNLFGFEYDSRLLAGKDVLSPQAVNAAILSNGSYITPDYSVDASTGEIRCFNGDEESVQKAAGAMQLYVDEKMNVSTAILNSNYYVHVFLGATESGSGFTGYEFDDIPTTLNLGTLNIICGNNYMDAESATHFGFKDTCTYAEFIETLYRICGSPETASAGCSAKYPASSAWAHENGISVYDEYADDIPAYRKDVAATMYNLAHFCGYGQELTDADFPIDPKDYPGITETQFTGMRWCMKNSIMRGTGGTIESVLTNADEEMTRFRIITTVYNYYLQFLREEALP